MHLTWPQLTAAQAAAWSEQSCTEWLSFSTARVISHDTSPNAHLVRSWCGVVYQRFPPFTGAPLAPILLTCAALACPPADFAAPFAFSAFFALSASLFLSFPCLTAASRAAFLASGRWDLRSLMTSREAPTMPRWDFTVRRVRFLAISCCEGVGWSVGVS